MSRGYLVGSGRLGPPPGYLSDRAYNPKQPRDPGGEGGGQWVKGGGGGPPPGWEWADDEVRFPVESQTGTGRGTYTPEEEAALTDHSTMAYPHKLRIPST